MSNSAVQMNSTREVRDSTLYSVTETPLCCYEVED